LRTNGGDEFTSATFNAFYESAGIMHEVTPPYTPQHNGVAERLNRTLLDMTRSMLKYFTMPKQFWGEAVSTAAYLLNRCPTKRKGIVTPEEAWSGLKPHIGHLRIFGCICYRHILDQQRRKLDSKGTTMVMLGYHCTGAYRLLDPAANKVVISSDVRFDEGKE
jgi:transposase InsO family protein